MEELLKQLNPEQQEAVRTIEGPLLVLAGAGTGKTRVITYRIAYMLRNLIGAEHILGMTFTNKAAREMKERLAALVGQERAKNVTLGTFHSFCGRILRKEIGILGFTGNFSIADESDQDGVIKQAMAELGLVKNDNFSLERVSYYISRMKNELRSPREASKTAANDFESAAAAVYEKYQDMLQLQNMLDFDDMLFFVFKIMNEHPEILKKYQDIYQYILVDEYQDTNAAQFEMLKMLAGPKMNLCVVGDDDQSIYGWRGAKIENILDFPRLFKGTKIIKLEQNYRSTNKILGAANKVIAGNGGRYEKNLWSDQGEGENVKILTLESGEAEAAFIADAVLDAIRDGEISYKDIAVLYRSNHLSRQLEQAFRQQQIPYRLVGGQEFFKRKEIKDAAAYLKLLTNDRDDQSFLRIIGVPARGIGDKVILHMRELQHNNFKSCLELLGDENILSSMSSKGASSAREFCACIKKYTEIFHTPGELAAKVSSYLEEIGYLNGLVKIYKDREDAERKRENVFEFISSIVQFEQRYGGSPYLFEFLESYALLDENDRTEEEKNDGNTVTFSTVHAAKGLEYPYVFIMGMEENIFPHERALKEGGVEEELRLFYVALTRAKRHLVISKARTRISRGYNSIQRPSEFLGLLPEESSSAMATDKFFGKASDDELRKGFEDIFRILEE